MSKSETDPVIPTVEPEPAIDPPAAVAPEPEVEVAAAPAKATPPPPAEPKRYAIIETGGKQYRVSVGDRISVERLPSDAGDELTIDRVLLVGGDGGTRVGTPVVSGVTVSASVDDHFRGEKIVVFKYKAKKRYRRRIGHRQSQTHLTITGINA